MRRATARHESGKGPSAQKRAQPLFAPLPNCQGRGNSRRRRAAYCQRRSGGRTSSRGAAETSNPGAREVFGGGPVRLLGGKLPYRYLVGHFVRTDISDI